MPPAHTIGQSFIELTSPDSTNNYAMDAARHGTGQHGMAWYSDSQTSGRGQHGHAWKDIPGQNIAISILLDTSGFHMSYQFALIMLGALATYDLLFPFCGTMLKIKWANDLYIGDKKAVGILTESIIKGQNWQWTVVGIGINVNQESFDETLRHRATSLRIATGKAMDTRQMSQELCKKMETRWQQLRQSGMESLLEDYNRCLYRKGERVAFKKKDSGECLSCVIDSVNKNGELIVSHAGRILPLQYGSVELVSLS